MITPIWKDIYDQLPSFRNETKVFIGNGLMTAFWLDLWFGSITLPTCSPPCFRIHLNRTPRLTTAATRDLLELSAPMASVQLDCSTNDRRVLRSNGKVPTSRDHYLISFQAFPDDPFALAIWKNYSPQKCKFFLWLLHRNRLSTRSRLLRCNI